jgi:hypothetical protein
MLPPAGDKNTRNKIQKGETGEAKKALQQEALNNHADRQHDHDKQASFDVTQFHDPMLNQAAAFANRIIALWYRLRAWQILLKYRRSVTR